MHFQTVPYCIDEHTSLVYNYCHIFITLLFTKQGAYRSHKRLVQHALNIVSIQMYAYHWCILPIFLYHCSTVIQCVIQIILLQHILFTNANDDYFLRGKGGEDAYLCKLFYCVLVLDDIHGNLGLFYVATSFRQVAYPGQ